MLTQGTQIKHCPHLREAHRYNSRRQHGYHYLVAINAEDSLYDSYIQTKTVWTEQSSPV